MSLTCDEVEDACIGRVRGRQVGHAQFSSTVCADHARGQWENTDTGIECKQHLVPNLQRCRHRESARVTLPSFKLSACSVSLMSSLACAITQFFWVGTSTFSTKRCDRKCVLPGHYRCHTPPLCSGSNGLQAGFALVTALGPLDVWVASLQVSFDVNHQTLQSFAYHAYCGNVFVLSWVVRGQDLMGCLPDVDLIIIRQPLGMPACHCA